MSTASRDTPAENGTTDDMTAVAHAPTTEITFDVIGVPAPQGSKRAFVQGERAVLVEMSKRVKPWRRIVTNSATLACMRTGFAPATGPVQVEIELRLPRPKRLPKGRTAPSVRPDIDKLVRSTLDGCTGVLWADDSLVVELHAVKTYADPGRPAGATITVTVLP